MVEQSKKLNEPFVIEHICIGGKVIGKCAVDPVLNLANGLLENVCLECGTVIWRVDPFYLKQEQLDEWRASSRQ